jgi:uncharacterized membrane protein YcaP (DUF421 family)
VELLSDLLEEFSRVLGLGSEPNDLSIVQISLRGLLTFAAAIWIVRVADKRFLAHKTAYDVVLSFILASMLSRAINGSAPFLGTIVCGFVLVLAHRVLAHWAARWHWLGGLVKGHEITLIENGTVNHDALRKHNLSHRDLEEDLRLEGVDAVDRVKKARLERSGDISVIEQEKQ